jgi:putative transposase
MDKNFYDIGENDLTYGRGYVYSLQYHIVWCTKYRRKVLKDLEQLQAYHRQVTGNDTSGDDAGK